MHLKFGLDAIWEILRTCSIICNWKSAQLQFRIVFGSFRYVASEFQPRHNMDVSWKIFNYLQFNFGRRTYWNCVRNFSKRCKWIFAGTIFWKVSNFFRENAFEFCLHSNLDPPWKNSDHMQLKFGQGTTCKSLSVFPIRCNLISAKTQFGIVSEYFWQCALEFGLWVNLHTSWKNLDQL